MSSASEEKPFQLYHGEALAPMVRASTTPLRTLALKYGADFVYSEELVDRAIMNTKRYFNKDLGTIDYYKDTSSLSKKQLRKIDPSSGPPVLLRIDPNIESGRLIFQLGTGEASNALKAALHVHNDVDAIDINMGCPKKFSVSGGMGSALLSDPRRACDIIKTLKSNLSKPISAKIRLLKDTSSTIDFCNSLINSNVNAIAIHGRRVGDEASSPADWETLSEVVTLLKSKHEHVPILINGDFYTRSEFTDFQEKTNANGVLLARPALYNTSIFRKPPTEENMPSPSPSSCYDYNSPLLLPKTRVVQDYLSEAVKYDTHYKNVKYVVCEMMTNRRAPIPRVHLLKQKFDNPTMHTISSVCNCHSLNDLCNLWNVDISSTTSNQSQTVNGMQQQQAGEHVYKDSYFLGNKGDKAKEEEEKKECNEKSSNSPTNKRQRIE